MTEKNKLDSKIQKITKDILMYKLNKINKISKNNDFISILLSITVSETLFLTEFAKDIMPEFNLDEFLSELTRLIKAVKNKKVNNYE